MTTKRTVIRYATTERKARVNKKNVATYDRYLKNRISRNKDVKETTYKQYTSAIYIFFCFLEERWDNPYILDEDFLEQFVDVMDDYVFFLQDELKNGRKKINFNMSAISSMYIYLISRKDIHYNPMSTIQRMEKAGDEVLVESIFLNEEQVEKIADELEKVTDPEYKLYDRQDRLMWHIGFDSAARIGALHSLSLSNLDLDNNLFANIREKRGKNVQIVFYPHTKVMIEEYLEWRKENGIDTDALFVTKNNGEWGQMSRQAMHARMKKIGHILDIPNWRFHNLRKTRLNIVAKIDINIASALANHDDLSTTKKFYTKKEEQSDVVNKLMLLEKEQEQAQDPK